MEIKYNLTEEDYLNFNMYHIKNSKTGKKALNLQRFSSPIIFLIFSYVFSIISDIPLLISFSTFLVMGILWIIFYPKHYYRHIIRNTKKFIKEGKNDGLLGDHTMTMTDEGIVDISSNRETKVSWSGIDRFKEDNENLYLYNSSLSAYILPKRELDNAEEVKRFIKSKINQ